jgi:hypothetical protein
MKHSAAGTVVDSIAVLSFPYTLQLLLVVLYSKGNMHASGRPPGLLPMQLFTWLLRQLLTQGPGGKQPAAAAAAGAYDMATADSGQDAAATTTEGSASKQ